MAAVKLKKLIVSSLRKQGFQVKKGRLSPPQSINKDTMREMHSLAVQHRIDKYRPTLATSEDALIDCFASGVEVNPEKIKPALVEVQRRSKDELLFRYACLHWSIPVSSGYGRRLRFLVKDQQNGKLIGLIGLGDPVYSLGLRDSWIGWDSGTKKEKLQNVMEAYVLGSVPPYSSLLCGKLVAMLVTSNEVRNAFKRKYGNQSSMISRRKLDSRLALITTTSALGRSSIYNRLKFQERHLFQSIGYTRGWGEFHFSNGLYDAITSYSLRYCIPTAKKEVWGTGFRNRREVIRKCLSKIGISTDWMNHGIYREIFMVPLAGNTQEFLSRKQSQLRAYNQPANKLFEWFRERWLLKRAQTDKRYLEFNSSVLRLWEKKDAR